MLILDNDRNLTRTDVTLPYPRSSCLPSARARYCLATVPITVVFLSNRWPNSIVAALWSFKCEFPRSVLLCIVVRTFYYATVYYSTPLHGAIVDSSTSIVLRYYY